MGIKTRQIAPDAKAAKDRQSDAICNLIIDEYENSKQHLWRYLLPKKVFMPLSIELIGKIYWEDGKLISLCHYYEQNGDLMADPQMCFILVDQRETDKTAYDKVMIVPYLYQQDNLGIYEESILFKNDVVARCDTDRQAEHVLFANQWLQNIVKQGFLKRTGR